MEERMKPSNEGTVKVERQVSRSLDKQDLIRANKRAAELETRLEALLRSRPCNPPCVSFSHSKQHQHSFGDDCPCVAAWHRAVDLACDALKKSRA
jgi:hypothetical protein